MKKFENIYPTLLTVMAKFQSDGKEITKLKCYPKKITIKILNTRSSTSTKAQKNCSLLKTKELMTQLSSTIKESLFGRRRCLTTTTMTAATSIITMKPSTPIITSTIIVRLSGDDSLPELEAAAQDKQENTYD